MEGLLSTGPTPSSLLLGCSRAQWTHKHVCYIVLPLFNFIGINTFTQFKRQSTRIWLLNISVHSSESLWYIQDFAAPSTFICLYVFTLITPYPVDLVKMVSWDFSQCKLLRIVKLVFMVYLLIKQTHVYLFYLFSLFLYVLIKKKGSHRWQKGSDKKPYIDLTEL